MAKKIILFIEDNDSDFEMAKRAFRTQNLKTNRRDSSNIKIVRHKDGSQSLKMLEEINNDTLDTKQFPNLIFLDLDIPVFDGNKVLLKIRQCQKLKRVPVIIFSGSSSTQDIIESYENGANSYIKKSLNFDKWLYQFNSLRNYWLDAVELPPHAL